MSANAVPNENWLRHGDAEPLPARTPLRAGPLTMGFESGDLRSITWGEWEVVRRIHAAVRDRNWVTVPATISDLKCEILETSFRIRYTSDHRQGGIHFAWQAEITGREDGSIEFTFDGEALTTFHRNRIGFCVLHPIRECAGAHCRVEYQDGRRRELTFPGRISSGQPVDGMTDLVRLTHEIRPGTWAELAFEGDAFEMEDQRNWIDASFKTFCTPLRHPFPVEIKSGTRVRQGIRLKLIRDATRRSDPESPEIPGLPSRAPLGLGCGSPFGPQPTASAIPLPSLGLACASHGGALAAQEINRLAWLRPAHLRVDVRASDSKTLDLLPPACATAAAWGSGIELAVHLDDPPGSRSAGEFLVALVRALEDAPCRLARILAFGSRRDRSTPAAVVGALREAFAGFDVPVGGGSNADLYELNLLPPSLDLDFVCWSMNPQVHAFDCRSIAETPEAAAQQVASARALHPGKPLVISPVTLKPRFNAVATGPDTPVPQGELPPQVDARQLSLFGACWTLAMIRALAGTGADSVTFFETTGWRGVMETEEGSPMPDRFPSIPGAVFPLYHVLADVGTFSGGEMVRSDVEATPLVAALTLRQDGIRRLILANLSPERRTIPVTGPARFERVRFLDTSNVIEAMTRPETFRRQWLPLAGREVCLAPHGLATLEGPG